MNNFYCLWYVLYVWWLKRKSPCTLHRFSLGIFHKQTDHNHCPPKTYSLCVCIKLLQSLLMNHSSVKTTENIMPYEQSVRETIAMFAVGTLVLLCYLFPINSVPFIIEKDIPKKRSIIFMFETMYRYSFPNKTHT